MFDVRVRARRSDFRLSNQQRFLAGALIAIALFLIEAGIAEISLVREAQCQAMVSRMRVGFGLQDVCQPDWLVYMLGATSRGVVGLLFPSAPALLAWIGMGVMYGVLGGGCAQLPLRWGIGVYLASHIALIAVLAGLGYISQFIA